MVRVALYLYIYLVGKQERRVYVLTELGSL